MNKSILIDTLKQYVNQRPRLETGNYGGGADGRSAYRSDARKITQALHDAHELLRYVELRDSITAEQILEAARNAYSGRLTITPVYIQNSGYYGLAPEVSRYELDYCTGQYWPMEYRNAVAAVMVRAIWAWLRDECIKTDEAEPVRKAARREFSAGVARRWFH